MQTFQYYYNGSINWSTINIFPFNKFKNSKLIFEIVKKFSKSKMHCKIINVNSELIIRLKELRIVKNYKTINYVENTDLLCEIEIAKIMEFCDLISKHSFNEIIIICPINNLPFEKLIQYYENIDSNVISNYCNFCICYNAKNLSGLYAMINLNVTREKEVLDFVRNMQQKYKYKS